ncbi:unnamed protein product [Discula destructiva]
MSAVPAWKRLGLKLKGPSTEGSPVSTVTQPTTTSNSAPPAARQTYRQQQPTFNRGGQYGDHDNGTPFNNKRQHQFPGSYSASDNKRPRRDDSNFTPSKTVSFSRDTKKAAPKKPKQPKKKKAPKPQKPTQPFDFAPVIEYLRTWHKARDSWKFNKNHQTLLIKYLYSSDAIPPSDIDIFYQYIGDIKGASRQRLVDQAKDVIKKDMDAGSKAFPEGSKASDHKQTQYEEILAELLKTEAEMKTAKAVDGKSSGKRSFDEVEFVLRTVDKEVQQRVVKRMRAEIIAEELESSDSGESADVSATVTSNTSSSTAEVPLYSIAADASSAGKAGEVPKPKTARRKKLRTGGDSSSSESDSDSSDSDSSDSDSDSDSEVRAAAGGVGSSSSSSSDGSDSDEEMVTGIDRSAAVASSSSSSSSSDAGSGSESESASGSDGDSESSDEEDA